MPVRSAVPARPKISARRRFHTTSRASASTITRPCVMLFSAASSRRPKSARSRLCRSSSFRSSRCTATARARSPMGPGSARAGISTVASWRASRRMARVMPSRRLSTPCSTSRAMSPSAAAAMPADSANCSNPSIAQTSASAACRATIRRSSRHLSTSSAMRLAARTKTRRCKAIVSESTPGPPWSRSTASVVKSSSIRSRRIRVRIVAWSGSAAAWARSISPMPATIARCTARRCGNVYAPALAPGATTKERWWASSAWMRAARALPVSASPTRLAVASWTRAVNRT